MQSAWGEYSFDVARSPGREVLDAGIAPIKEMQTILHIIVDARIETQCMAAAPRRKWWLALLLAASRKIARLALRYSWRPVCLFREKTSRHGRNDLTVQGVRNGDNNERNQ